MSKISIHPWDYFWINLDQGMLKIMGKESERLYNQVCRLDFCPDDEKNYEYSVPLSELRKLREARPNKFVRINENTEARKFKGGLQLRIILADKTADLVTFTKKEFQRIEEYL